MTTVKVAKELGRVGIGYEKEEKYKPVIMKKLGVKEEDLKKPGNKKPEAELSNEERKESIKTLRTEILPSIAEETKSKGERISRLSFTLKPNLLKKDISVESVPVEDDLPPTSPLLFPEQGKPDDYAEKEELLASESLVMAEAA
jgi:hypothetical protein